MGAASTVPTTPKKAVVRQPLAAAFLLLLSGFEQVECPAEWTAGFMPFDAQASFSCGFGGNSI